VVRSGAHDNRRKRAEETTATVTGTSEEYATPIGMLGQPSLNRRREPALDGRVVAIGIRREWNQTCAASVRDVPRRNGFPRHHTLLSRRSVADSSVGLGGAHKTAREAPADSVAPYGEDGLAAVSGAGELRSVVAEILPKDLLHAEKGQEYSIQRVDSDAVEGQTVAGLAEGQARRHEAAMPARLPAPAPRRRSGPRRLAVQPEDDDSAD
jgi:hypothetical protein